MGLKVQCEVSTASDGLGSRYLLVLWFPEVYSQFIHLQEHFTELTYGDKHNGDAYFPFIAGLGKLVDCQ